KSGRWWPRERLPAALCSDGHSRRSPVFDSQNLLSPVGTLRCPKGLLCRTRNSLGLFRLRSRFLAFYGHLKRLTQNVVVANCAFPHEHEQVAPCRVFHGLLAQRWRIQHNVDCVAYLDRHVVARGVRDATSGSLMSLNLSDRGHLI